jgi:hypothetical protein
VVSSEAAAMGVDAGEGELGGAAALNSAVLAGNRGASHRRGAAGNGASSDRASVVSVDGSAAAVGSEAAGALATGLDGVVRRVEALAANR